MRGRSVACSASRRADTLKKERIKKHSHLDAVSPEQFEAAHTRRGGGVSETLCVGRVLIVAVVVAG